MNRRELLRDSLLGVFGAAAAGSAEAREFPQGYDASKELARPDWKPKFFDEHQNETVVVLSDLIIPETKTPGAKAALVNRFLDELLAVEDRTVQQSFLNSLSFLDGDCMDRYKAAFIHVPVEFQHEYLSFVAYPHSLDTWGEGAAEKNPAHEHFENLKSWIARAFWNSEAGKKALGWNGEVPHGVFAGCDHPESAHRS
jgi:gluconate 2-dehydrogenase gamma chain